MSEADGSEDVNDFLLRIRELGDQRDKEDEERTRKLEEEILQGRKERQARRAGQSRSVRWRTREDGADRLLQSARAPSRPSRIRPPMREHPTRCAPQWTRPCRI